MLKYILKRILIFIPTLIAISLLTYVISINAPGDPVEMMLNTNNSGQGQSSQKIATEKSYIDLRHSLGLDLPLFYFSFTNMAVSDTLYKIPKIRHREVLQRLCDNFGNWPYIAKFYLSTKKLDLALYDIKRDSINASALRMSKDYMSSLLQSHDKKKINTIYSNMDFLIKNNPGLLDASNLNLYRASKNAFAEVTIHATPYKKYIPVIYFYGLNNQYHNWISKFIVGDFGISYQDRRPVSSVLLDAVRWTMLISFLSIIISYSVAIPIGVKSAVTKGTRSDRAVTTTLFMLYSLPNFWIATMLIMFLCGGDYLDWFPAFGLGSLSETEPFFARFTDTAYHLILPLFCLTYASFAYLSRQMRGGMLNVIGQDFIRTARAKGLSEEKVVWKHAFRNSLLPVITLFASIFPLIIAGSFVIEFIFSIPGMGKVTYEALMFRNYPIVFTVMMFSAILALIGNLVADILYAIVDPRISFASKKS